MLRRIAVVLSVVALALAVAYAAVPKKAVLPDRDEESDVALRKDAFNYLFKKTQKPPRGTGVPKKEPWVWCWDQYKVNEKKQDVLYVLISEHLAIAQNRYFVGKEVATRRKGLGMAVEAARCAFRRVKDIELAELICNGFIWPHLDDADDESQSYLGKTNVLETIAAIHAEAKNAGKCISAYQLMIDNASNRNTADGARLRLAQVLAKKERYKEAIQVLEEIDDDAGVGGGKRLISELRTKMNEKRK